MNWQETAIVVGLFSLRIVLPLLITLGIGELVSRLYTSRQRPPVDEAAGAVYEGYELRPHCWEVMNCPPDICETCPAYLRPQIPCWLALQLAGRDLPEECFSCEIFHRTQSVVAGNAVMMAQGGWPSMLTLGSKRLKGMAFALLGAGVLAFANVPVALAQGEIYSPDECAACHPEAYDSWNTTAHASTPFRPEYLHAWKEAGQPAYCRQCHGTGYNPVTGEFVLPGVTCQSCHQETDGESHPGGQMSVDTTAELCATCHSGAHAPTYEEWLLSEHGTMNIDCLTCHEPHNDGLRADDVNELCGRCHKESADGSAHNIEGTECSFCHMYGAQQLTGPAETLQGTGHTFEIPPDVCASCHGMEHTLPVTAASATGGRAAEPEAEPAASEEEWESRISDLETRARENLDLGLAGGGLGGLVLGGAMVWAIQRGALA